MTNPCLVHIKNKVHHSYVPRNTDHAELEVLGKGIVPLDVLVDGKQEVVNFCKYVFHAPELEYNLLSVSTIEKSGYLILAKKGKMTVLDNEDNVALEATRIRTSYLVNIPTSGELRIQYHIITHGLSSIIVLDI